MHGGQENTCDLHHSEIMAPGAHLSMVRFTPESCRDGRSATTVKMGQ
jgi:hypothetical protein